MQHICAVTGKEFEITEDDLKFYEKMGVPPPTLCPEERQRRRLAWQNMRNLYKRKCDATGQQIISNISPDKPFRVYKQDFWWSDKWNFKEYGMDFDFNKSFFEQFEKLIHATPMVNVFTEFFKDENSEFTNFAGSNKNCYLIFHADCNEDCFFATGLKNSKDVVDGINIFSSELLYECIDCRRCYNTKFSQDCENCSNSWFLKNCIGCKNCFGCINLRQNEYYLFQKKVSRKEYEKFLSDFESSNYSVIERYKDEFLAFQKAHVQKATQGYQNEGCSGDHIFRCQNVKSSFDIQESRDMRYCERVYNGPNSDCYDVDQFGMKMEKFYECSAVGVNSQNVISCFQAYSISDTFYSGYIFNSRNCFGCCGAHQAKYCILNRQYSKEQYEQLVPQIIEHMQKTGEWGEFFPIEISPFAYNETVAQEYFPLTKEEALNMRSSYSLPLQKGNERGIPEEENLPLSPSFKKRGNTPYKWRDEENKTSDYEKVIPAEKLPDDISQIPDDILNWAIKCEESKKLFKIQKAELKFYRTMNLPIPHFHPDIRHQHRMKLRNPRKLFPRNCDKCHKQIQTTFAPERKETVYCEECYLGVVL